MLLGEFFVMLLVAIGCFTFCTCNDDDLRELEENFLQQCRDDPERCEEWTSAEQRMVSGNLKNYCQQYLEKIGVRKTDCTGTLGPTDIIFPKTNHRPMHEVPSVDCMCPDDTYYTIVQAVVKNQGIVKPNCVYRLQKNTSMENFIHSLVCDFVNTS